MENGSLASGQLQDTAPEDSKQSDNTDALPDSPTPKENWRDALPDDLKKVETLAKFVGKDATEVLPVLAKSYVELEKMKFPGKDAKPEELNAFYDKIGRPKTPKEYSIERPETLPPGVEWDEKLEEGFRTAAHKAGLNNIQAQQLLQWYNEEYMGEVADAYWTPEKGMAALEQVWQTDAELKKQLTRVNRLTHEFADEKFRDLLDQSGMGNHPEMLAFLARVAEKLVVEDTQPGRGPQQGGMTHDEARAEIAKIRNDRNHPYHRGDREATAYMQKLYEVLHSKKVLFEV